MTFTLSDVEHFKWFIERRYAINYYLDSLPAKSSTKNWHRDFVARKHFYWGTPIGYKVGNDYYIYNHYKIQIELNEANNKYLIVGFQIEPQSIIQKTELECKELKLHSLSNSTDHKSQIKINENNNNFGQKIEPGIIGFTYDVEFISSNKTFATRWDYYLPHKNEMHWFGLISANILIFIISFIVLYILTRSIKKDIDIYNTKVISDDFIDEFGWKQICNDVFRPPKHLFTLCALVGTGVELFLLFSQSLYFIFVGYLSPDNRAKLINLFIIIFCFMGFFAGFFSNLLYKINGGKQWLKCCIVTAIFFPGLIISALILTRLLFIFERSSGGVHLSHIFILIVLWFCISSPLVFLGSLMAIRMKKLSFPCKVNSVPTKIEQKPIYLSAKYMFLFTGIIPFSTVFVEFIYIMVAIWRHQVYFILSFIGFGTVCLVVSSAEISIIFVYINLCKGDYRWWWKSFFIGASCSFYFFTYSIFYFFKINITRFTAIIIYFVIMSLISVGIGLVCGGVSVLATLAFLYFIYSKIKID